MSTRIPPPPRLDRAAPEWPGLATVLPHGEDLTARTLGTAVTDHRSSWVRRVVANGGHTVFVKTYEYASWADRLRDFGRRTAPWAAPRSCREFDALVWLRAHDLPTAAPLAVLTWRRAGFVTRTCLVTAAWPGEAAATLLPTIPTAERIEVAAAIGRFVQRLHTTGFRDGNLDLRNLLVARTAAGIAVAKIDSPRWRRRPPGPPRDALADADWARLLPQLAVLDLATAARSAASTPV